MTHSWYCCPDQQPCNPAVGGPAKSQLVHEVDALGGEIGRMADRLVLYKALQYSSLSSAVLLLSWNMIFHLLRWLHNSIYIYGVLSNIHFSQILLLLHTWLSPSVCSLYRCYLQKRVLNRSKGPAVWALRAQTDKREYAAEMKKIVERCIISLKSPPVVLNFSESLVTNLPSDCCVAFVTVQRICIYVRQWLQRCW